MAIPISNVTRRQVYAPSGAGGAGPYAFTFEILANTDIAVFKDDTLLTLTTHYTVTINANGTGSVTITATGLALDPTSPAQYAIVGNRTISRTTDFTTGGDFFANTLNDELDQQTIFAQQNAEGVQRAMSAPQTDPTSINMTLPRAALRANKTMGFDASGNPIVTDTIGTNRGNWAAGTLYYIRDLIKDTTNSNIWQCVVQHTSSGSQPIGSNVDAAKWALLVDAAAAATSAANAATSASAAASSASAASSSATAAASSASSASTSASTATTQASNAATSATNAATSASAASVSATSSASSAANSSASATASASSATSSANSAAAASAVVLGNEPVRPSVRPSLLLDFANSKTLDPRITFTRASTATYYDGVTSAVAEQNLFLQSQTFDNAAWAKISVTITADTVAAPDGTTTADTVTLSAGTGITPRMVAASNIAGAASTSVVSVFAKANTQNFIQITNNAGTAYHCNFDVSAGTVGTSNNCTGTITSFGSGWYRCSVVCTPTNTADIAGRFNLVSSSSAVKGETWNPVGTEVIYIWGAQIEQRSAITAYTPTTTAAITNYIPVLQTAASGVARLEHNPITGESLGLLIEEQRTNLLTYSEQFDNAAWTKSAASVTTNTIVSPDGALDGEKLVENTALDNHLITQSLTKAASAITYTLSCYLKTNGRNVKLLIDGGTNSNRADALFDLTSGTIIVAAAAVGTFSSPVASITSVGNDWYRCTLTGTTGTETTLRSRIWTASGVSDTYTGDGFSGIYIWGAQLEASAFATSYIPTVASQVTRSADAASMTGTNFSSWYAVDQGTLYGELAKLSAASGRLLEISDGTSTNRTLIYGSTNLLFDVRVSGVDQAAITLGSVTSGVFTRVTAAYKVNDFIGAKDGTLSSADTSGVINPNLTQMFIGAGTGSTGFLNGTIKKIAYYPMRVTNAQLQGITTV
jgi:hypothetical protein